METHPHPSQGMESCKPWTNFRRSRVFKVFYNGSTRRIGISPWDLSHPGPRAKQPVGLRAARAILDGDERDSRIFFRPNFFQQGYRVIKC